MFGVMMLFQSLTNRVYKYSMSEVNGAHDVHVCLFRTAHGMLAACMTLSLHARQDWLQLLSDPHIGVSGATAVCVRLQTSGHTLFNKQRALGNNLANRALQALQDGSRHLKAPLKSWCWNICQYVLTDYLGHQTLPLAALNVNKNQRQIHPMCRLGYQTGAQARKGSFRVISEVCLSSSCKCIQHLKESCSHNVSWDKQGWLHALVHSMEAHPTLWGQS